MHEWCDVVWFNYQIKGETKGKTKSTSSEM